MFLDEKIQSEQTELDNVLYEEQKKLKLIRRRKEE